MKLIIAVTAVVLAGSVPAIAAEPPHLTDICHPSKQPEEVFVTNSTLNGANQVGFTSKRVVPQAFDVNGRSVIGAMAVFASRAEVESLGIHVVDAACASGR